MATKNNPKNKGTAGSKKTYNGKDIEPIKYIGSYANQGIYISAKYAKTNEIILDSKNTPVLWSSIPNAE